MTRVPATHNARGIYPTKCRLKLTVCYRADSGKFCEHMDHITNSAYGSVTVWCSAPVSKKGKKA